MTLGLPENSRTHAITYDQGWIEAGQIELTTQGLTLSGTIPDEPGLYCLLFDQSTRYYGEASNLQRRLGDYLLYYEATGIESEFRINKALNQYKGAQIRIVKGSDLQSKSQRCVVESRVIKQAREDKITVLNGGSTLDRIAFHAREIMRLSTKLVNEQRSKV